MVIYTGTPLCGRRHRFSPEASSMSYYLSTNSFGTGDNIIIFFHGLVQIVLYKHRLFLKPDRTNVVMYMLQYEI